MLLLDTYAQCKRSSTSAVTGSELRGSLERVISASTQDSDLSTIAPSHHLVLQREGRLGAQLRCMISRGMSPPTVGKPFYNPKPDATRVVTEAGGHVHDSEQSILGRIEIRRLTRITDHDKA